MSKQGDKILSLTQMILQNSKILVTRTASTHMTPQANSNSGTIKALCLAALVAATGNKALTRIPSEMNRPVNRYERTEIKALVFYAAQKLGDSETDITLRMMNDLGYVHTDDLTTADYRKIREYMWQLLMRAA